MVDVDPHDHLTLLERLLRDLLQSELPDWSDKIDDERRAGLESKIIEEGKRRRGIRHSSRLVDYLEFTELQNLILKNYPVFESALGSKEYVRFYFKRLNAFRNPTMHGRQILGFERSLIEGIVGEFRQQVALFRTEKDPMMNHYPMIDVVTDSFGRSRNRTIGYTDEKIRVQVGDCIEFVCRGSDPQGRKLTWWVREQHDQEPRDTAGGYEVTLRLRFEERDVMENAYVLIYVASDGRYHAARDHDEAVAYFYAVDPPQSR